MMVIERIGYRYPTWKVGVRVIVLDMAVRLSLWLRHSDGGWKGGANLRVIDHEI